MMSRSNAAIISTAIVVGLIGLAYMWPATQQVQNVIINRGDCCHACPDKGAIVGDSDADGSGGYGIPTGYEPSGSVAGGETAYLGAWPNFPDVARSSAVRSGDDVGEQTDNANLSPTSLTGFQEADGDDCCDIIVVQSGGSMLPEPAVWITMLSGFFLIGSMVRASRKQLSET